MSGLLSPPVRMHGGLLCIAFCMYVCMSGCDLTKIHQWTDLKFPKERCFDLVKGDQKPLKLAGGLTSTSSCIFCSGLILRTCDPQLCTYCRLSPRNHSHNFPVARIGQGTLDRPGNRTRDLYHWASPPPFTLCCLIRMFKWCELSLEF